MTGIVTLKIHQKIKAANGEQWLEVWSRCDSVSRMEHLVKRARSALATFCEDFPGVEFQGTSTVETMGDW